MTALKMSRIYHLDQCCNENDCHNCIVLIDIIINYKRIYVYGNINKYMEVFCR